MKNIYLVSLLILITLTSCGKNSDNDNNLSSSKTNEENALIQGELGADFVEPSGKININENLSDVDQQRLNIILSSDKTKQSVEHNLESKLEDINLEIKGLESGSVKKVHPLTLDALSLDDYKSLRLTESTFIDPVSGEESTLPNIDIDILFAEFNSSNANPEQFFTDDQVLLDRFGEDIDLDAVRESEMNKALNSFKEKNKLLSVYYKEEKKAIENGSFDDFLYISEIEKENRLKDLQAQKDELISQIQLNNELNVIKNQYLSVSSKKTEFNPNEIVNLFEKLGDLVSSDDFIYINSETANEVINSFMTQDKVKLTKVLESGMKIESNSFYVGINLDGRDVFIDDTFFLELQSSLNNDWKDFIVMVDSSSEGFSETFLKFVTGVSMDESYYSSINKRLLRNGSPEIFENIFTINNNDSTVNGVIEGNSNIDISSNGILGNTLSFILGNKASLNDFSQGEMKEYLISQF